MANSFSDQPKLVKGALVEFSSRFIGPVPNIIVFQYNPEKLTRSLEVWQPPDEPSPTEGEEGDGAAAAASNGRTQPEDPPESFSLDLELDAHDVISGPGSRPQAALVGVADRISALELLLHPEPEDSLLEDIGEAIAGAFGGGSDEVEPPREQKVPVVLFVWGIGRVVPVRLTSFQVEEQAYSSQLYPIRAKVSVGLKVLPASAFESGASLAEDIAIGAFTWTQEQKRVLGAANLIGSISEIGGVLPL